MHTIRKARVFLWHLHLSLSLTSLRSLGQAKITKTKTIGVPKRKGGTYIIQRAIRADRAPRLQVAHLAHDRGNAASAQPRSSASYQFSERAEELALGERCLEREEVREDTDDHQQFLCRIAFHEREERRVQRVRNFDLVRVLTQEEHTFIDQLADNETEDLPKITTGD